MSTNFQQRPLDTNGNNNMRIQLGPILTDEQVARDVVIYAKSTERLDQLIKNACPSDMVNAEDFALDPQNSDEIKRIDKEIQLSGSDVQKKNLLLVYKYYLKGYLTDGQLNSAFLEKKPADLFTNNAKMYPLKEDLR